MKLDASENDIQAAIVELLMLFERQGKLRVVHIPNQLPRPSMLVNLIGKKSVAVIYALIDRTLQALGKRNGFPDLQVLFPDGGSIFFEVKSKSGVLSKEQKLWMSWLNDNGFPAHVVRDVDEVKNHIEWRLAGAA